MALKDSSIIYAFVDLHDNQTDETTSPTVFIVPVKDVAQQAIEAGFLEHPDWYTFYFKIYRRDKEKYSEAWSVITSALDS